MGRHKWNGRGKIKVDANHGGLTVYCVRCGCIKEFVTGYPTYFIDDTLYDKIAPKCDKRLIKHHTPTIKKP